MILGVDIGNSSVSFGLVSNRIVHARSSLPVDHRNIETYVGVFNSFISQAGVSARSLQSSVLASVVPDYSSAIANALETLLGKPCFVIRPGIHIGMSILYDPPVSLGSDRVVNAFTVRYKYGFPAVCIDFGTATTFCILDSNGDFQGGLILPGINSFTGILPDSTALLPRVTFQMPPEIIAKTTIYNIQSGLFHGYISMVEGLLAKIRNEMACDCPVVATGGSHGLIKGYIPSISVYDENLTLEGLEMLYEYNCNPPNTGIWGNPEDRE